MEWYSILTLVIGILGALFGGAFFLKFREAINLLEELGGMMLATGEVFEKAAEALKDRKVTKAEAVLLLKAWQDACVEFVGVYDALKELLPASIIKFLFRR